MLRSSHRRGVPDSRTARRHRGQSVAAARGEAAAGRPRTPASQPRRGRLDRSTRGRHLGRASAADGRQEPPGLRLPASEGAGRRRARDAGAWLQTQCRGRPARRRPVRGGARAWAGATRGRRRARRCRRPQGRACAVAGTTARRLRRRAVCPGGDRSAGRASARGTRDENRGRPRARTARRARARTRSARPAGATTRAPAGAAHARAVSHRPPGRCARKLQARTSRPRERARARAGPRAAGARAGHPPAGAGARSPRHRRGVRPASCAAGADG